MSRSEKFIPLYRTKGLWDIGISPRKTEENEEGEEKTINLLSSLSSLLRGEKTLILRITPTPAWRRDER
jgi:hypothetical protein